MACGALYTAGFIWRCCIFAPIWDYFDIYGRRIIDVARQFRLRVCLGLMLSAPNVHIWC